MDFSAPYRELGGAEGLRVLLTDFYERIYADPMIGYMFEPFDKAHLIKMEGELAGQIFGGPGYTGRPLGAAHRHLKINLGQFQRRNRILLETLQDHDVSAEIQTDWMAHAKRLQRAIVHSGDCLTETSDTPAKVTLHGP